MIAVHGRRPQTEEAVEAEVYRRALVPHVQKMTDAAAAALILERYFSNPAEATIVTKPK